ncbi:MAG: hypothetical protein IT367_18485 [Candidatus Hydrogenedentes bacterium]|nr:hypothetical protein [Candidatus Hydrogenedentota bacterium]
MIGCGSGANKEPVKPDSQSTATPVSNASPDAGKLIAYPPIPVVTKADANAKDLMVNGSFEKPLEEEPRAWMVKPEGAPLSVEENLVAEGKRALRVEMGDATNIALTQTLKVPAQSRYELQGLALAQNVNGAVKLVARDAAGNRYTVESGAAPGNSSAWSPLSLKIAAPAFVRELVVGVEYVAAAQKIYEGPSALALDRFKLIDRGAPANMIANGDFTLGVTGMDRWQSAGNLEIVKEETGFTPDLPTAVKITLAGSQNLGIYQTVSGLEPGKPYVCRAYIKCENLMGDACIELQHGTKGFQGFLQRTEKLTGTQTWQWVSTEFTPKDDMTSVNVLLRRPVAGANIDATGSVWFARCELFPSDAG